jgi:hypothetical protein
LYAFSGITLEDDPWGEKPTTYDVECRRNEIWVVVADEVTRELILMDGGLRFDQRRAKKGRILAYDVASLGLQKNDRLDPSFGLQDIGAFERQPVPFVCCFWRGITDARGRIDSWVSRRCPLFSPEVGASPSTTCQIDTLHTLYLGVFATFVHGVLRGAMDSDVFRSGLPKKGREANTLSRLTNDYSHVFDDGRQFVVEIVSSQLCIP